MLMKFQYVILAVSFMLLVNTLYAGFSGTLFNIASRPDESGCKSSDMIKSSATYCAKYFPNIPSYAASVINVNGLYNDCLNKLSSVTPPYCSAKNPAAYYPFADRDSLNINDPGEGIGLFINYVSTIFKVPFDNVYLMLINICCVMVIVIFAWKAASPMSSVY
jgi:hypothetical protein